MRNPAPVVALLVALSGCAAVEARREDGAAEFYSGTRENVAQRRDPDPEDRPLRRLMYVVDLPFSAILDTLLIPVDYLRRSKAE
ncbi:MAG: YceK/YidQ family lipoprotein [Elusimicrobiota bacterium]|nr:YceK/YidQ family lipoprotein [Elusimicrobiota bacterium]